MYSAGRETTRWESGNGGGKYIWLGVGLLVGSRKKGGKYIRLGVGLLVRSRKRGGKYIWLGVGLRVGR